MALRTNYHRIGKDAVASLRDLDGYLAESRIDGGLLELVKLRASQINGCAYCVGMHADAARDRGESEERLQSLVVWRESSAFTARERAALAWTEAVTLLSEGIPEDVRQKAESHFSEEELVDLTFGVVAINAWNRLSVPFREPEVPE